MKTMKQILDKLEFMDSGDYYNGFCDALEWFLDKEIEK